MNGSGSTRQADSPPLTLNERLEAFRRSDAERDALLQNVLQAYSQLQQEYETKCIDYDDAVEARRRWQSEASDAKRYVQILQRNSDTNPFVLALIDGDGALFQDALYKAGSNGGKQAGPQLR